MSNVQRAIELLGKSECDESVRKLLNEFGVTQPLKRPHRGEDQINVLVEDQPIELCFATSNSLPKQENTLIEDEMVLAVVFAEARQNQANTDLADVLPFGLSMRLSRAEMRKKLGSPSWSSPVLNNDRWILGEVKVLACFTDDEASIRQLAFSLSK